ncbi:MAG: contractile injection system tape measure protein [Gilvibacter sp.]
MSKHPSHIIEKLTVAVQTNSKKLAYTIKDEKDVFFLEELMALLGSIFDEHLEEYQQLVRLDTINIEINASAADFEFDIKRQLQEKLAAVLPSHIFEDLSKRKELQIADHDSESTALLHFLQKGTFPWWFDAPSNNTAMDALIYDCIDQPAFINGFTTALNNQTFKKRCIAQLSDGFLNIILASIVANQRERYNLPSKLDKTLQLASHKAYRNDFWNFVATSIVSKNKSKLAQLWQRFIKATPKDIAIELSVAKKIDQLAKKAIGASFFKSNPSSLLSELANASNANHKKDGSEHVEDSSAVESESDLSKDVKSSSEERLAPLEEDKNKVKDQIKEAASDASTPDTMDANDPIVHHTQDSDSHGKGSLDELAIKAQKDQEINDKNAVEQTAFDKNQSDLSTPQASTETNETLSDTFSKKEPPGNEDEPIYNEHDHEKVYKKSKQEDQEAIQTDSQSNDTQSHKTQDLESLAEQASEEKSKEALDKEDYRAEGSNDDPELSTTHNQNDQDTIKDKLHQEEKLEQFYAAHCGLVLLHPFLTPFLKNCDLLDKDKGLKDPTLTAHLLHYVATGKTAAYEHQLQFERFLCHIPTGLPLDRHITLTPELMAKADELLHAMLGHLPQLKSSKAKLLQNEFLSRDGKIVLTGENPRITIERKTQDMLLDSKPWSTSIVKLPWLPYLIFVDW